MTTVKFQIGDTHYTVTPNGISSGGPEHDKVPPEVRRAALREQAQECHLLAQDYKDIAEWIEEWEKK